MNWLFLTIFTIIGFKNTKDFLIIVTKTGTKRIDHEIQIYTVNKRNVRLVGFIL